jgi:NodT family efflux transporter outer membrane factor (OMF) lipoprotein
LRWYLFTLVCLLGLTGCVNYVGIHSDSKPTDDYMLHSSYNDKIVPPKNKIACACREWWTRFKDPELNRLINTALADSPSLQVAESRVHEAQHLAELMGSNLFPSLNFASEISRERITDTGLLPPPLGGNTYTETNIALNFNYEFDFWGKNRQVLASKISLANAAKADYFQARLVLSTAVASTYFQLQSNELQLKISRAILKAQDDLANIVVVRARHGVESDIPVTSANADTQTLRINVTQLRESVKLSQHELAALIGKNPFTCAINARKFHYDASLVKIPKVIPANLLARRPDLLAARMRAESAAHEINAAKARFYPNFNIIALLSLQSFTLQKALILPSRDNSIGVAIDLPIFDAGARRANLREKYSEFDQAIGSYNDTILTGLREVADQVSKLNSLNAQQRDQNGVLRDTLRNYQLTVARYRHGIVDYTNVLQVKSSLLRQQDQQVDLQTRHLQAMIAMIKALGGTYITAEG